MRRVEARLMVSKILVADDSATMRVCVSYLLRELGIRQIDEAANGALAYTMFRRRRYDLVISDWTMPLVDGLDLLRAIRGGNVRNETPLLMLTVSSDAGRLHEAIGAGASGFVPKPFFNPTLKEQVSKLVSERPLPRPKAKESRPAVSAQR